MQILVLWDQIFAQIGGGCSTRRPAEGTESSLSHLPHKTQPGCSTRRPAEGTESSSIRLMGSLTAVAQPVGPQRVLKVVLSCTGLRGVGVAQPVGPQRVLKVRFRL